MREIKFRAWDRNKMRDDFSIYAKDGSAYGYLNRELNEDKHNYVLMQYTGLKDKNGKEIYEGDIVKRTMHYGNDRGERCGKGEERITAVKWSKQDGMQMVGFSFFPCDDINQLEVIGNIYENQELLKG